MSILTKILLGLVVVAVFPLLFFTAAVLKVQHAWRDKIDDFEKVLVKERAENFDLLHGDRVLYVRSFSWLTPDAARGNFSSEVRLGYLYENGMGVPKDLAEAVRLYRKGADEEDALGQRYLGDLYFNGRGVPQSYAEALKWYRLAAAQNDDGAFVHLGYMYDHGLGVTMDHVEAVRWFRKAADQNNSAGQWDLGWAYAYGKGVAKDMTKALSLIRAAAAQGETGAQQWLLEHGEALPVR